MPMLGPHLALLPSFSFTHYSLCVYIFLATRQSARLRAWIVLFLVPSPSSILTVFCKSKQRNSGKEKEDGIAEELSPS